MICSFTNRTGRLLTALIVCLSFGVAAASAAPAPAPKSAADSAGANPISDLLGPGSTLEADGEFEMMQGDDGQISNFHAVDNVSLETKEFDLTCDEMTYNRPEGKILAVAGRKGRVNIIMRNMNATGPATSQSVTRASCGHYEYFVNTQRHVLTQDPVIHQRGADGKETVITGKTITLTQDKKTGRVNMLVQRGARMYDPKSERAREMKGMVAKPTANIDMKTTQETPKVAAPKAAKIDEGNVGTLQQAKPKRVARLEEGG